MPDRPVRISQVRSLQRFSLPPTLTCSRWACLIRFSKTQLSSDPSLFRFLVKRVLLPRYLYLQPPNLAAVTTPPGQNSVVPLKPRSAVCCREVYEARIENRRSCFVPGRPLETFPWSIFTVILSTADRLRGADGNRIRTGFRSAGEKKTKALCSGKLRGITVFFHALICLPSIYSLTLHGCRVLTTLRALPSGE